MKVVTEDGLGWRTRKIKFTTAELVVMKRASELAERARELAAAEVGPDWEHCPQDMTLAEVEHNAREIVEEGIVLSEEYGVNFDLILGASR